MPNHKDLSRLIPIAFIALFSFFFVLLSLGVFNQPRNLASSAQDAWKCPGNQCDRCGYQGWWASGCDVFCAANPGKAPCTKIDGPLTPCGGFAKMCAYPADDGKTSCIANDLWRCGNDGCYHKVEPSASCGSPPTSTPSPQGNQSSSSQSASSSSSSTVTATDTGTAALSIDPNNAFSIIRGVYHFIMPSGLISSMLQADTQIPTSSSSSIGSSDNSSSSLPPSSSSASSQDNLRTARQLVSSIQTYCQENNVAGRVTIRNYPCLDRIIPSLPSETLRLLKQFTTYRTPDGQPWDHVQCVGVVRSISNYVSNESGEEICNRTLGSAIGCAQDSLYYDFINNYDGVPIRVGDYPIWRCSSLNPYGHIAHVTEVYDNSNVRVAEGNWDGLGTVQERNVEIKQTPISQTPSRCEVIGWLRKKV